MRDRSDPPHHRSAEIVRFKGLTRIARFVHTAQGRTNGTDQSKVGGGSMPMATGAARADEAMPAIAVAPPSRRRGRVSRGHVVMAVAGIAGVVLSFVVLRGRPGDAAVLVAAHEIRAGESVS